MPQHDLVIRGGTVADGTGRRRFTADVVVDGATITEVGRVGLRGRRELDADGLVVAPGWVDIHTHYDGQVLWDPLLSSSSTHGVTTVVFGNCGVGFAPSRAERRDWLVGLMVGVEDIPGDVLNAGIAWEWGSFEEYLNVLDRRRLAIDVAAQVPHAALRVYVMGERGEDHAEAPTADEIARMAAETARALEAGAAGFSTSRSVLHKGADGRITPSYGATRDELTGIARAAAAVGRGVFEIVTDYVDLEQEFELVRLLASVSGRPTSVTTVQRQGRQPEEFRRQLDLIERAVADGLSLRGQVAPRPPGAVMTLDGAVQPLLGSPTYRTLAPLDLPRRVAQLRRPEVRRRILDELADQDPSAACLQLYPYTFAMARPARYDYPPEDCIAAIAARRGLRQEEVAYDILVEPDGRGVIWAPGANFERPDLSATREMLVHPWTLPGIGDGGAHCTIVCDASFPTFLLTHWARDAAPEDRLDVEWVVKRQAADTAGWVGLPDRGVVAPGRRADLNLIDLERLELGVPEIRPDLPLGGKRLAQPVTGYRATIVAGAVVLEDGVHSGALPGRLARPVPGPGA
jgi:N-acyl-D-aspartate/D-glutamate deacylase